MLDGKGPPRLERVEAVAGDRRRRAAVDLEALPAREDVAGRDVLDPPPGPRPAVQRLDLDEIPGGLHDVVLRLAGRGGSAPRAAARDEAMVRRFPQAPGGLQTRQDAPEPRRRDPRPRAPQPDDERVLAPAGVLRAQGQDGLGQGGRPGRLAQLTGPRGARLQARQVLGIVPALPAGAGLAADPAVPTRQGRRTAMGTPPSPHHPDVSPLILNEIIHMARYCLHVTAHHSTTAGVPRRTGAVSLGDAVVSCGVHCGMKALLMATASARNTPSCVLCIVKDVRGTGRSQQ